MARKRQRELMEQQGMLGAQGGLFAMPASRKQKAYRTGDISDLYRAQAAQAAANPALQLQALQTLLQGNQTGVNPLSLLILLQASLQGNLPQSQAITRALLSSLPMRNALQQISATGTLPGMMPAGAVPGMSTSEVPGVVAPSAAPTEAVSSPSVPIPGVVPGQSGQILASPLGMASPPIPLPGVGAGENQATAQNPEGSTPNA